MAGDRATLVDVGEAVLVGEAWVTVTDVVPLDIGTVVGVVGVTRGRTAGTLIYILGTVLTLPFCFTGAGVVGQIVDLCTG